LTTFAGGAFDFQVVNNGAAIDLGVISSSYSNDFSFDVFSPNQTEYTKITGFGFVNSTSFGGLGSGLVATTTSYSTFTLTTSAGTLSAGTITVYGYRN
jgi:hypothetical protein